MYSKPAKSDSASKSLRNSVLGNDVSGVEQLPSDGHSDDVAADYDKTSLSRLTHWFPRNMEAPPISYTVEMNVMWWVVLALAFITRFWRIDFPSYVV